MKNFRVLSKNKEIRTIIVNDKGKLIILKENNSLDPNAINMLKNESKILDIIQNSNISPKLYNFYEFGNKVQLEEEYIQGCLLSEYKFQDNYDRVKIIFDLLDTVSKLHSFNIIHCDLKPDNIVITNDNQIKILDFGISIKDELNQFTRFMTLNYASLEKIKGKKITVQTDIYSLGCIIYEVLYGQRLFTGNRKEIIEKKKNNFYNSTNQIEFDKIIKKSLSYTNNNYKNILELKKDLERIIIIK